VRNCTALVFVNTFSCECITPTYCFKKIFNVGTVDAVTPLQQNNKNVHIGSAFKMHGQVLYKVCV
jgi:hypothetical protein